MNRDQFENEKLYEITMAIIRSMKDKGIIKYDEYLRLEKIFLNKYKPIIGALYSSISLT